MEKRGFVAILGPQRGKAFLHMGSCQEARPLGAGTLNRSPFQAELLELGGAYQQEEGNTLEPGLDSCSEEIQPGSSSGVVGNLVDTPHRHMVD